MLFNQAKIELENQLGDLHDEMDRIQKNMRRKEDERSRMEEALHAAKEVSCHRYSPTM